MTEVYKERRNVQWGTIEEKDPNGNVINTRKGIVCGRGETKKTIDPNQVYEMAKVHCTVKEMSEIIGINEDTLKYNFNEYIIKGKTETKIRLRTAQLQAAYSGNTTMMIWLGKNILGQTDAVNNTSADEPLPWMDD